MWWDKALNTNKMSEKDTNKQLSRREHGDHRVNWEVGENTAVIISLTSNS